MSTLKTIREDLLDVTQSELGAAIGCTQGNIGFYERKGQTIPHPKAMRLIAYAKKRGLILSLEQIYGYKPLPRKAAA